MFHIETASPRWRRLAAAGLALPLSFAISGTAIAAEGDDERSSAAVVGLDVSCFAISAVSDKDLSNVKVTFADGSFQEINGLSGDTFTRTFTKQIDFATAKSGRTEVTDPAGACAAAPEEGQDVEDENGEKSVKNEKVVKVVKDAKAVKDDKIAKAVKDAKAVQEARAAKDDKAAKDDESGLPTPGQGTAAVSISVDCDSVNVSSDKDISNVKVTFVDGSFLEINGLSGHTFERTFAKDIDFATAKSATTEVRGDADACAAVAPVVVDETPLVVDKKPVVVDRTPVVRDKAPVVEERAPICPTVDVTGPVMEGCETPTVVTPIAEQPAPQPATGAPVDQAPVDQTPVDQAPADQAPVDQTPVDQTPVVAEETPDQAAIGTPIAEQPEAQPVLAAAPVAAPAPAPAPAPAAAAPVAGSPAQAALGVVSNSATAPAAVSTVAAPAALPFTGTDTDALLQLGAVLVMAGGGALFAGRRERTAKHARTAKDALLA